MMDIPKKKLLVLLLAALMLWGCDAAPAPVPAEPTVIPGKPVASQFLPLYHTIAMVVPGGLGAARTEAEETNGQIRQVFDGGVLVYDENSQETFLAPVGRGQIPPEPPAGEPQGPTWQRIGGYWAPASIASIYEALGERIMGRPLSNYRYNEHKQRFEMYFENLGLYILEADVYNQVHLLPYGAWVYAGMPLSQGETPQRNIMRDAAEAFDAWGKRVPPAFTGEEIAPLVTDDSGRILRVYDNLVVQWVAEENKVAPIPVPLELGMEREPLAPEVSDKRLRFLPLNDSGTLGHNIPRFLWDNTVGRYSALDVSGYPIMELAYKPGTGQQVYWQCFENLCVEYDSGTGEATVSPLGREYYHRFLKQQSEEGPSPLARLEIEIQQAQRRISPQESQEVTVRITERGAPVSSISPVLIIHLPSGQVNLPFPPTDANGKTSVRLGPFEDTPNGTVIEYAVCVPSGKGGSEVCPKEQFVVWDVAP